MYKRQNRKSARQAGKVDAEHHPRRPVGHRNGLEQHIEQQGQPDHPAEVDGNEALRQEKHRQKGQITRNHQRRGQPQRQGADQRQDQPQQRGRPEQRPHLIPRMPQDQQTRPRDGFQVEPGDILVRGGLGKGLVGGGTDKRPEGADNHLSLILI